MSLKINKKFKELCPPLTDEEFNQLEANILNPGRVREEILVWKNQIIDGHNRYEIATKHGIQFDTAQIDFEDEHAACNWIIDNQLGRRNMTPQSASYLRGKKYLGEKKESDQPPKNHEKPHENTRGQNEPASAEPVRTAEKIASETGVSAATVKRDAKKAEALDLLPDWFRNGYRKGEYKATEAALKKAAKLPQGELGTVMRVVRTEGKSLDEALGMKPGEKPKKAKAKDYGKCPACAGSKWKETDDGIVCAKCQHPHGEPAGDVDGDRVGTQRSKTVKTVEALMRAFDDLNMLLAKPAHKGAIASCKTLLHTAKDWK